MDIEYSDEVIIDKVLKGEEREYNILIDRYKKFVYTIAFRILKNEEDAEEAAQDTFIKGYQSLSKFSGKSKYSTWLYRIVFNTSISYKRKRKIEVSGLEDHINIIHSGNSTSENIEMEDQRKYIDIALNKLNPIDATVITLFYLKEHNLEEVSQITGLTKSAIKVKLFRSRKKMAEDLNNRLSLEPASIL